MKFNGRNVFISPKAHIGQNVRIGDNTVIYDNVVIGDGSTIANDCVLGEPTAAYYRATETYENPVLAIGEDSLIRSHCIFYAGSTFGRGLITGHRATVREGAQVGEHCLISTLVDVQGNCRIGHYSRLYSNVHVGELTELGDFVFVFPFTVFTNDPQPPSATLLGSSVGDYSMVTVNCSVLPGVRIGANCLVGANSVVARDIEDYSFAVGSPAKRLRDIREIPSKEDGTKSHYPWPQNFSRGLPWEKEGFAQWATHNQSL